ncbi:MAG: Npt1/Npt2 family nucleotide transporter [Bacteroidota bacterium]
MKKSQATISFIFFKLFDIRTGELRRALLMQLNIFLIISTLLILKPTINGLFLAQYGVEQLPIAYILVAIVAALVSVTYARLLAKIPLRTISISTLIGSVVSLIIFGLFLHFRLLENSLLYLFYIWVSIFALLTTSQFWVLANMVFNPREAKRLFGFVGAGAIAGGIFGGYLTSILAEIIGSERLPFVCAGLLLCCIPITISIWEKNVANVTPAFERKRNIKKSTARPLQLIRQSKHLTYIACIVGVSVMVAKLVDYLFGGIASKLIPDADELTAFFGFWFSTFNVISLILQLFLTRKIVGTYGVGVSLFFLPVMIFVASVLLLFFPTLLMAAVFLKMADGSLKQSINKASMELLIMPISQEIKNQTKIFIDVFVDSLATGFIGLLLIFIIKGRDLPMVAVSWIIVGLLLLWIYFAQKVRKEYLRAFRLKLREVAPKSKSEKTFDLANQSVLDGFRKVLAQGEEAQKLFVLQKIKQQPDDRLFFSIKKLLDDPSNAVRAEALNNLYFFKKYNLSDQVRQLTHHPSQKVKIAAFEYLLLRVPEDEIELMGKYLTDKDYRVSGAALVSLAKETKRNLTLQHQLNLDTVLDKKIVSLQNITAPEERQFLKISLLKSIGYAGFSSYYHLIKQYFSDTDPRVAQEAITAAGHTLSPLFVNELLYFLKEKNTRPHAEAALANFKEGLIPILKFKISQPDFELEILRRVPAVVKKISRQVSVDFLLELLKHNDGIVRLEALRGLNMLRNLHPHLNFYPKAIAQKILDEATLYQRTLSILYAQIKYEEDAPQQNEAVKEARKSLVEILEKRLHRNLERIFRLLGLKYPPDDIFQIYRGLNSNQSDLSINAIEFLDNLLEPDLKKTIIPLIESSMLETISEEAIRNLNLPIVTPEACFEMLLEGKDERVKIATLFLIGKLGAQKYLPLIERLLHHPSPKIQHYAEVTKKILSPESP